MRSWHVASHQQCLENTFLHSLTNRVHCPTLELLTNTEICRSQCSCLCKFFVEVWHVWSKVHKSKGPINFSKMNMHVYSLPKPRWEIDLVPEAGVKPPSVTYSLPRWHSSDFYHPILRASFLNVIYIIYYSAVSSSFYSFLWDLFICLNNNNALFQCITSH